MKFRLIYNFKKSGAVGDVLSEKAFMNDLRLVKRFSREVVGEKEFLTGTDGI